MSKTIKCYQDGASFYDDETGDALFVVSYVVKDFDMEAAKRARAEFVLWFARELPMHEIEWA